MDINCKDYNEADCKTRNANCKWAGKRNCIRRDGVLGGTRYTYTPGGKNVVIMGIPSPQFDLPEEVPVQQVTQELISYGGVGVAFSPPFPCTNGQFYSHRYIGKVFFRERDADDEWELAHKIKEIEKGTTQKYFTYPLFQCKINFKCPLNGTPVSSLTPGEKELYDLFLEKRSKVFLDSNNRVLPEVTQQVMEYSGTHLLRYFEEHYKTELVSRAELVHVVENLFYAIKRMNDMGYVHLDIKEANVVISNTKRLRLIDFGTCVTKTQQSDPYDNYLLMTLYDGYSPPENHMYALLYLNTLNYNDVINWLPARYTTAYKNYEPANNESRTNEFIKYLQDSVNEALFNDPDLKFIFEDSFTDPEALGFLKGLLIAMFKTEENKLLSTIGLKINFNTKDLSIYKNTYLAKKLRPDEFDEVVTIVKELIKKTYSKIWNENDFSSKSDTYSIGTTILRLTMNNFLKDPADDHPEAVRLFQVLMNGLLAINPNDRFNVTQAIEIVKQIKTIPHDDPFLKNKDIDEVKRRFINFGKKRFKKFKQKFRYLNKDILYLKSLSSVPV
jgi:serine/threonine protein kinase